MEEIRDIRKSAISARNASISVMEDKKAALKSRMEKIENKYASRKRPAKDEDTSTPHSPATKRADVNLDSVDSFLESVASGINPLRGKK